MIGERTRRQAEARARGLRAGLYRLSRGGVVSRYVGETGKRLGGVLMQVERSGAVLIFDEGDALLGRRSEVRDAHDRHADTESAFLLERDGKT